MIKRCVKVYVIVTSVMFAIWVGLAMYMGLEENGMADYCDYSAPKEWAYYTSQGEPCRPRHFFILKETVLLMATILLPVQSPAYGYFVISAVVRRRRTQAPNPRESMRSG